MHTPQDNLESIVLNDTVTICNILRTKEIKERTKVLLPLPSANLQYIYDVALDHEHYEVCRTIKLILDLRSTQKAAPDLEMTDRS